MKKNPECFYGDSEKDPVEHTEFWISSMERIFGALHFPNERKTLFAIYHLIDFAHVWWENQHATYDLELYFLTG